MTLPLFCLCVFAFPISSYLVLTSLLIFRLFAFAVHKSFRLSSHLMFDTLSCISRHFWFFPFSFVFFLSSTFLVFLLTSYIHLLRFPILPLPHVICHPRLSSSLIFACTLFILSFFLTFFSPSPSILFCLTFIDLLFLSRRSCLMFSFLLSFFSYLLFILFFPSCSFPYIPVASF